MIQKIWHHSRTLNRLLCCILSGWISMCHVDANKTYLVEFWILKFPLNFFDGSNFWALDVDWNWMSLVPQPSLPANILFPIPSPNTLLISSANNIVMGFLWRFYAYLETKIEINNFDSFIINEIHVIKHLQRCAWSLGMGGL